MIVALRERSGELAYFVPDLNSHATGHSPSRGDSEPVVSRPDESSHPRPAAASAAERNRLRWTDPEYREKHSEAIRRGQRKRREREAFEKACVGVAP